MRDIINFFSVLRCRPWYVVAVILLQSGVMLGTVPDGYARMPVLAETEWVDSPGEFAVWTSELTQSVRLPYDFRTVLSCTPFYLPVIQLAEPPDVSEHCFLSEEYHSDSKSLPHFIRKIPSPESKTDPEPSFRLQ